MRLWTLHMPHTHTLAHPSAPPDWRMGSFIAAFLARCLVSSSLGGCQGEVTLVMYLSHNKRHSRAYHWRFVTSSPLTSLHEPEAIIAFKGFALCTLNHSPFSTSLFYFPHVVVRLKTCKNWYEADKSTWMSFFKGHQRNPLPRTKQ